MTTPSVSFEFFPPKTLQASFHLWDCVNTLAPLDPTFVSVTYGAGGTTRKRTHEAVATLRETTDLPIVAHLTCVNATKAETLAICDAYRAAGVTDIMALRGDPPKGADNFCVHPDGFESSVELIDAIAARGDFNIAVGAYPETHPEAQSPEADIDYLKRKLDAGATRAVTQFFFEADTFFRFRDRCAKAGITVPILPGILPIENWSGAKRFAQACSTHIPTVIADAFENAERDNRTDLLATALATELCDDLIEGGVDHLHFYTLNNPELTREVCHALGVTPRLSALKVA